MIRAADKQRGTTFWRGTEEMTRGIERLTKGVPSRLGSALANVAEEICTSAKKLTPVDTGNLRSSIHVERPPKITARAVEVRFGAGGPAGVGNIGGETNTEVVSYAYVIHEDLEMRHASGQAKFLEIPFEEAKRDFGRRLLKHARLLFDETLRGR
jgi:hypothetical protein